MSSHPLRKALWKIGLDVRRYRPEPDHLIWLKEAGIKTVLDVGANVGQFAHEIRIDLPRAFIYSFEPLKDCYDELVKSMKDDGRFKAFHFALGDKNEEIVMHKNDYSPSSSILEMDEKHKDLYPHTKNTKNEKITVRTLDGLKEFSTLPKKEILLKIDTQGYEDRVLRGGTMFLSHVKVILVETSFVTLYKNQYLFDDIYKMLTGLGFVYKGGMHQRFDTKKGGNLFEDSIFVRK
jgi:FkbM family methyltransferase